MPKRGDLVWLVDPKGARPAVVVEVHGERLFVVVGTGTNRTDLAPVRCIPQSRDGRLFGLSKDTFFATINARAAASTEVTRVAGPGSTRLLGAVLEMLARDGVEVPADDSPAPE